MINNMLPPYDKFPCHTVAQHREFHFLFSLSAILFRSLLATAEKFYKPHLIANNL